MFNATSKYGPPKLYVMLAREADVAVVFRRGPSKQVAVFLWDRSNDVFELGQWFKGRIKEHDSDLSPDGKHLIYLAEKGGYLSDSEPWMWTAVSRAPYLKALDFFPQQRRYYGGGLFITNNVYWLNFNEYSKHTVERTESGLAQDSNYSETFNGLPKRTAQLVRDGWRLADAAQITAEHDVKTFEKVVQNNCKLIKLVHAQTDGPASRSSHWEEHRINHDDLGEIATGADWEWADVDGGRVVWACEGCLYAAEPGAGGMSEPVLLHDFQPYTFEERIAPY